MGETLQDKGKLVIVWRGLAKEDNLLSGCEGEISRREKTWEKRSKLFCYP